MTPSSPWGVLTCTSCEIPAFRRSGQRLCGGGPDLSTFLRNMIATLAVPLVLYYTINELTVFGLIPDFLSPTVMMYRPLSSLNMAGNVAYTLLLCLAVILLMGWLFDERVRKEFEHGWSAMLRHAVPEMAGLLRVITVFIFLAIFAYDANWNVLTFSRTSGVPVTPWVYPAVFSDRYLMMCICLAVMVLFCDAPFLDRHQPYLILRSGRGHWALGTAGYLLASSAVVSASIFLMGDAPGHGHPHLLHWLGGSVLQSVAGKSIIPTRILALYSPLAACGLAMLLSSLIFCFLGLLFSCAISWRPLWWELWP